MHNTHLFKSIISYLESQENKTSRKIKKVYICLSEFGSLNSKHFFEHYSQAVCGTRWEGLEIVISTIPFGPELEITGLDFFKETEARKSEICKLKENKS